MNSTLLRFRFRLSFSPTESSIKNLCHRPSSLPASSFNFFLFCARHTDTFFVVFVTKYWFLFSKRGYRLIFFPSSNGRLEHNNIHHSVSAPFFLSSSVIPWNQVIWFQDFITCKNFAQRNLSLLSCAFRLVCERFAPCVIALSAVSFYLYNHLIHDGQAYRRKSDRSNDSR